jgi:hypothetical protein
MRHTPYHKVTSHQPSTNKKDNFKLLSKKTVSIQHGIQVKALFIYRNISNTLTFKMEDMALRKGGILVNKPICARMMRDLRHWKPLPDNDWWRYAIFSTCCSDLLRVWINDAVIVTCNYDLYICLYRSEYMFRHNYLSVNGIVSFPSFTWLYKYKEEYKQGEMWHSDQRPELSDEVCMYQPGRCQATVTWLISAETKNEEFLIARQRFRNHGYIDGNNWSRML